ncbi:MAG: hypothetical protein ACFHXK_09950 [bacterium]
MGRVISLLGVMRKNLLLLIALFLLHPTAHACSCISQTGSEEEILRSAFSRAPLVFIGTAVEQKSGFFDEYERETVFNTEHIFKGQAAKPIKTNIWIGCCACGFDFRIGERYLVFAYPHHEIEGTFSVNTCGLTSELNEKTLTQIELLHEISGEVPDDA